MKALFVVNDESELLSAFEQLGPLVPLSVCCYPLGVSRRHSYRLASEGKLRVVSVFGEYAVPVADLVARLRVSTGDVPSNQRTGQSVLAC